MSKLFAAVAVAALMAGAAHAAPAKPAPQAIELGDFMGRLRSIKVKTAGGEEGLFTVDTGGGVTVVSPEFARKLGCEPWGRLTGFRLSGERLGMPRCDKARLTLAPGVTVTAPAAGVLDLQPFLPPGAPKVDGSLALDALKGQVFTLELGAGRLTFETPESLKVRIQNATAVPLHTARQAGGFSFGVLVPVPTAKGELWMALDSGGGPPVLVGDHIAKELGLDPASDKGMQPYALEVAGAAPVKVETRALVRDMIMDGNIGMPVLVKWTLTFDLANDRLWIAPATK